MRISLRIREGCSGLQILGRCALRIQGQTLYFVARESILASLRSKNNTIPRFAPKSQAKRCI